MDNSDLIKALQDILKLPLIICILICYALKKSDDIIPNIVHNHQTNQQTITTRLRRRNRIRNRNHALNEMENLSDRDFKRMFRMSRFAFDNLEHLITDSIRDRNRSHAINSSNSNISVKTKLACALRWMAGGSYIDICFEFGISPGSFYQEDGVLWETLYAIDSCFKIGFPFHDNDELSNISRGFSRFSHGRMDKCVLAVDGWVCRTRQPYNGEVEYPSSYRNRKGCFGIVILGGCDSNLKFYMWSCIASGSTSDVTIWDMCYMKQCLNDGMLSDQYYFIGDEAFVNTSQFLVPYSGHGLDLWSDSFNYHLSAMRQSIERAFGVLTQRWGIFWRELRCQFDKWTLVCTVAAKLHNYLIDINEGKENDIMPRRDQDIDEGDEYRVIMNSNVDDGEGRYRGRPSGDTRSTIRSYLQDIGAQRPTYAMGNSRM
jgi:DDE superfamily endonuclease